MTQRDYQIHLSEEQREVESIRTAFGIWNDVLYTLSDSAHQLRALGEDRQAEAMAIDAESMARRARLHLKNMMVRERQRLAELDGTLTEVVTGVVANTNTQDEDQGAA